MHYLPKLFRIMIIFLVLKVIHYRPIHGSIVLLFNKPHFYEIAVEKVSFYFNKKSIKKVNYTVVLMFKRSDRDSILL